MRIPPIRRFSGGIFRRQFIALSGTTLFFFATAAAALLWGSGKAIIERQLAVSAAYRDEIRFRIVDWLDERRSDIEYLARTIDSESPGEFDFDVARRKLALFGSTELVFSNVALLDAEGRAVADKNGRLAPGPSGKDRDYFAAALRGESFVSSLITGKVGQRPEIAVEAPLRWRSSVSGARALCVVGFLPVGVLSSIVENVSLRDLGSAYLFDGEGRIISVADYASRIKFFGRESAGAVVDNYATRELAAGRAGMGEYRGYGGIPVVGAFAKIEPTGFGIAVELSRDRALQPVTDVLRSGIILLLIAFVLILIVSAALSASLVAPIRVLVSAAEAVARDRVHGTIEIRTGTELDQLALHFNEMASAVRVREEVLKDSAARDSLTGLYNHARIVEFLDLELKRKRRSGQKVSFVMLDIDHFKKVNDIHGHLVGDEVLRILSRILEGEVRGGDIAGRYGGEEFSVILDAFSDEEVASFCERIRAKVEAEDFCVEGRKVKATVSLGWIRTDAQGLTVLDIVRGADRALYAAKAGGRNKVVAAELVPGAGPAERTGD
jgi:diguanylate cyclase (GGDEF)-like protein